MDHITYTPRARSAQHTVPPVAADPLAALIDAAANRAAEFHADRIAELVTRTLPEILTDELLLGMMHWSRPTLRDRLREGLPHAVLGTQRRYVRTDVVAWVRAQYQQPVGRPQKFGEHDVEHAEVLEP